jgi:hypothetical protein
MRVKTRNSNTIGSMNMSDLIRLRNKKNAQVVSKRSSLLQRSTNIANSVRINEKLADKKKQIFRDGMMKSTNTMMYPYLLQTVNSEVLPNQKAVSKISVNGEASMIVTHYSRTIFRVEDVGGGLIIPIYKKPDDFSVAGEVGDVKVLINDLSSDRTFTPSAVSLTSFGHSQEPTRLEESLYLDPNKNVEVIFDNQTTDTYFCSLMFFGFRLSIEDANHMFNQVTLSV